MHDHGAGENEKKLREAGGPNGAELEAAFTTLAKLGWAHSKRCKDPDCEFDKAIKAGLVVIEATLEIVAPERVEQIRGRGRQVEAEIIARHGGNVLAAAEELREAGFTEELIESFLEAHGGAGWARPGMFPTSTSKAQVH